jgi:hypothetical protein
LAIRVDADCQESGAGGKVGEIAGSRSGASRFLGNAGRLALVCGFFRKNMPMPNDAYYATFPLRITGIPVEDLTA